MGRVFGRREAANVSRFERGMFRFRFLERRVLNMTLRELCLPQGASLYAQLRDSRYAPSANGDLRSLTSEIPSGINYISSSSFTTYGRRYGDDHGSHPRIHLARTSDCSSSGENLVLHAPKLHSGLGEESGRAESPPCLTPTTPNVVRNTLDSE